MSSTTYSDFVGPPVNAAWLNDVNKVAYNKTFPDGTVALTSAPGSLLDATAVSYEPAGTGFVSTTVAAKLKQTISVLDFGADPTGATDSTSAIQAAINYACGLVTAVSTGDPINGATVLFRGVFKITAPLTVGASNVVLDGQGGTTIYPYYTSTTIGSQIYNGAPPVFIIGTAQLWQGSGTYSSTYKYNRINGFIIKRPTGGSYIGAIGVLCSGTRNASITNMLIETQYCGLYLENTSEIFVEQISSIGCTYGYILDSRNNRSSSQSVLNLSCTGNDVSSCNFNMLTAYYPQSTGFMTINCGTINVSSMTIGQFSTSIDTTGTLGLPNGTGAGIYIDGGAPGTNDFGRGSIFTDVVFEAPGNIFIDCIFINSTTGQELVQGITFQNCVVQTYAPANSSYLTTFISAQTLNAGLISNIVCNNCGFVYQSSGYYYGQMANNYGNTGILFDSCYPLVAFSNSLLAPSDHINNKVVVDTPALTAFPPSGWTANGSSGSCTYGGGSSGVPSYITFTGSTSAITISKDYVFVNYAPLAAPFIEFLVNGSTGNNLLVYAIVNGVSETQSNNGNGTQPARYSNALYFPTSVSSTNKRYIFTFNPFSANYGFNDVTFYIGINNSSSASNTVTISNIRVGYFEGQSVAYNPFS